MLLPPEIMEAILRLLPAKSLGRFKSVSKTWNALISDPQFIKNHLLHLQTTPKLVLISDTYTDSLYSLDTNQLLPYLLNINSRNDDDDDDDNYYYISATVKELSFRSPFRWKEILGSCNGLLLVAPYFDDYIIMVNPTTQEGWEVPLLTVPLPWKEYSFRHGFGYDASTDDYKVVSILFIKPLSQFSSVSPKTVVCVYSLRNRSWKLLSDSPYDHTAFPLVRGALVTQKFHWLVISSTIVAFSFETEQFNEISLQLPEKYERWNLWFYDLVEIGGKLGVCLGIYRGFEWWVMEDYGDSNSWTMVSLHQFKRPARPVCLVGGSYRDIVLDHDDEDEVLVFNIDEEVRRYVTIEGGPDDFTIGGTYVESLELPTRIVEGAP